MKLKRNCSVIKYRKLIVPLDVDSYFIQGPCHRSCNVPILKSTLKVLQPEVATVALRYLPTYRSVGIWMYFAVFMNGKCS